MSIIYDEPPVPEDDQIKRDIAYVTVIGVISLSGFFAKRRIQRSLEDRVPDQAERAAVSYLIVAASGAVIGGTLKAIRTGTEGITSGVVIGTIFALCGALAAEVYDYRTAPRPK